MSKRRNRHRNNDIYQNWWHPVVQPTQITAVSTNQRSGGKKKKARYGVWIDQHSEMVQRIVGEPYFCIGDKDK